MAARLRGITLGVVLLAAILFPLPLGAQQRVDLEQAVDDELIEYVIVGGSIAFAEPMLSLELRNVSQDSLTVEALVGLELNSENPDHADVIVGKDSITLLQPEETRQVDLYAFSLDPSRSFPSPDAYYVVGQTTDERELLAALVYIGEQDAEEDLSAQLAVWMQSTGYDFEQLEDTLDVPLGRYYTETLSLLEGATRRKSFEPSSTLSSAGTSSPESSSLVLAGILIAAGIVIVILIALPVHVGRQNRRRPEEKAHRLASPSGSVLATAGPTCIGCNKPLSQCTCAGRVQGEPMGQPLRLEMKENRAREKTLNIRPGVRLVALEGKCAGNQYNLPQSDVLLTRSGLPFVATPLPVISSPHALIFLDERTFRIRDLNSTNGIRVNGQRLPVSPEVPLQDRTASLQDGTQVTFGNASFTFEENPPLLRDDQGQVYRLPPGQRVLITRHELPCLEVKDDTVSVPHALVRWESEQYTVTDLNSGNGTEVGLRAVEGFEYRRLNVPVLLVAGMRLRLGNAVLEVRTVSGATVPRAQEERIGLPIRRQH